MCTLVVVNADIVHTRVQGYKSQKELETFKAARVGMVYPFPIPIVQYWQKELDILFCSITTTNLGQFSKPGTDLKSAGPDVFKTPPKCTI